MTTVKFEGIFNFRDADGIRTIDGRKIKPGLIFRSGDLNTSTLNDIDQLENSLKVQTIFDYRDDDEAKNSPTPAMEGIKFVRIPARKADSVLETANMKDIMKNQNFQHFSLDSFTDFYRELPIANPSYIKLVDEFSKYSVPLLHHCTAGKDRTGVGAMILFLILDVSFEDIMKDYMLTNQSLRANPPSWVGIVEELIPDKEVVKAIVGVNASFLTAAYDSIIDHYGTVETYLLQDYGIDETLRKEIQNHYLE
ncbi:tyrosine-protein phosphatase [Kurthia sibirica]|uniref:Protein-tyrosine-phosphatase n=1 Tax=Kurthia sibirica TaxID=202750 RepID=A0A2U3AN29_9BACL|nr:tyrosine-protein phosphatase [Kurthia sibirica]PWI25944.1 protein-tyrosine-phosphatase [Kurthia sibirica]GEK35148.1 protein-tyrosine-phosphatase [Kurthia sibirica]